MGDDGGFVVGLPELVLDGSARCVGHPLRNDFGSCPNHGSVTLMAVLVRDDGGPMPVLVTVCPKHVRPVRHWLEAQGIGDPVETWATVTLGENLGIVQESGLDWHVLRSA